jgi:hypothetical protein
MANWKNQVAGCFGADDLIWAGHEEDQRRCRQLLQDAIESGATMEDIVETVRGYLQSKRASKDHIDEQIRSVRDLKTT